MPPIARPFPRFLADSAQESRPYGRWEGRLRESFAAGCESLTEEAETPLDFDSVRFFPERTWGGRTFIPAIGAGTEQNSDGYDVEFFGHVSFWRPAEDSDPGELVAEGDFTDVTASSNPDWQVDLNDDVVGDWRADGGRGGDVTLIWGTPLVRGALAATVELDGEVVDQAAVNEGRFTLMAVDAVHGFGDEDIYCVVRLWDRKFNAIASESLYADDEEAGEAEADPAAEGDSEPDDQEPAQGR